MARPRAAHADPGSEQIQIYERSVVAAVLTNGLLDAVQPGTDSRMAAKRVVAL